VEQYEVIRDTRERQGWYFPKKDRCAGMIDKGLKTGDYTLRGYEDIVCIERKASPEELALNLGKHKDRFVRELERMKDIEHRYIVCEFSLDELLNFPENSRMPEEKKKGLRITGRYMIRCLIEFGIKYNVHVLYCGTKVNAFKVTESIFKRMVENYGFTATGIER
jgi:dsDNA-binding SOS-regulon protein